MRLVKASEYPTYQAPGHFNMTALRVQHRDTTGTKSFWVGLSVFQPGGGVELSRNDTEKVYFLVSGRLTITSGDGKEYILEPFDSLHLEPGDQRAILNKSNIPAFMLVISAYPEGTVQKK